MNSNPSNSQAPKGLLVLGMHRSGTSALTRVLNLLGADLCKTLWQGNEANRKGFWEDPRIFGIHDTLLQALGRSWDDLRALPDQWLDAAATVTACDQLVELLQAEFSQSSLWIVKDPRICRLLPLWRQVFDRLGASMHCVLALRHPEEVARSLKFRNDHQMATSRLAWLEHTAESVIASRGLPRTVVPYSQLMADWEGTVQRVASELGLAWPIASIDVRTQVEEFLSPDERHHNVEWLSGNGAGGLVGQLFAGMLLAAEGKGWGLADEAALLYANSRQAFLDALNSKQEEFDMQRKQWMDERQAFLDTLNSKQEEFDMQQKQWMGERQALSNEIENKLQQYWRELGERLAMEISAGTRNALSDMARAQLEAHIRAIEDRLTERSEVMYAQLSSTLATHADVLQERLDGTFHDYSEPLSDMLEETKKRVDSLYAAVASVKPARDEIISLQQSRYQLSEEVRLLRNSSSWRITAPLRAAVTKARKPNMIGRNARFLIDLTRTSLKQHGMLKTGWKIIAAPWRQGHRKLISRVPPSIEQGGGASEVFATLPAALPALNRLELRVLMVAELGLPQCRQYRVVQKQQMLEKLGIDSTVVSWTDMAKCRSLLQTHSVVIFYRVPGFPDQLQLVREAKELGLATFWEVDDIIFDAQKYMANTNLAHLDDETRKGIMFGIPLYRAMLVECGAGIASTEGVADAMRETGLQKVFVVENALDAEAVRIASEIGRDGVEKSSDGLIRIVYGSGSRAHDADFRVAARGIRRVLKARPNVRLTVIGELNLPLADYGRIMGQVERLPTAHYATYMRQLAACDISIAPLEDTAFNDAKSNIKFLEAALVNLPSVCSPRAAFRTAITDGTNGYLPGDGSAWEKDLLALVDDPALRGSMARNAREQVLSHYDASRLAIEQLEPVFKQLRGCRRPKLRVLGVNIFFAPRSFGGATIVAEEMMKRVNAREDFEYAMFTTVPISVVAPYELVRYSWAGGDVFAMGLPPEGAPTYSFNNPHSSSPFSEVLQAYRPDVVHLHSVQGIGARIAEICVREKIPFVVTLHDAWWICERQFMVNVGGRYCHQRKIDLDICASCVPDRKANRVRQGWLREILQSAELLFAPSEFFRQLYLDNGFESGRVVVNKNGIAPPRRTIRRESLKNRPLRIGFVGGEGPIKGAPLIRKALRSLKFANYELHVVDNELNLGRRSIEPSLWEIPGQLKVVPAYTQATIDDFFESIDVLLFPTQWKESFGLTVREALIRDVWVVATDAGGVVEDIVDGENGQIIPLGDDGTRLAETIGGLLECPERLSEYRNPHASQIRFFDQQVEEICGYLSSVVAVAHTAESSCDARQLRA